MNMISLVFNGDASKRYTTREHHSIKAFIAGIGFWCYRMQDGTLRNSIGHSDQQ